MSTTGVNLLSLLTADRDLPPGYDAWAVKSVRPDLTTRKGFRYPWPGRVAKAPGPIDKDNTSTSPFSEGDGICAALTWLGMASGGIPAITLLLVAYRNADVLGDSVDKLRLTRMKIVDVVDGVRLVREHGAGANLTRANLYGANLTRADLNGASLKGADLTRANLYGAIGYRP